MSDKRVTVIRLIPVLDFGGVESLVVLQAQLTDRDRFDLRICTFWKPGAAAEAIRDAGLTVDVLGVDPAIRNVEATAALYRYLRKVKPDVLHASIGEAMWHGSIAGALAGVPWRLIEDVGLPARAPLARALFSAVARLNHAVIGVSQGTCDYLIERERMPASLVRLIYNCGKPQFFGEVTRERAAPRPFRVLSAGRLVPVKNQPMLIEAFARLTRLMPDAELWLAGEGDARPELEALIERLGMASQIKLLGFRDDVRALMDQADVFVLPSHTEGCSVALVEAMASGCPVIGSTAGGIVEVMGELGSQWLVDAHDLEGWTQALARMARLTTAERAALGQRGREIAIARFSPEVYMGNLQALYLEGARRFA